MFEVKKICATICALYLFQSVSAGLTYHNVTADAASDTMGKQAAETLIVTVERFNDGSVKRVLDANFCTLENIFKLICANLNEQEQAVLAFKLYNGVTEAPQTNDTNAE